MAEGTFEGKIVEKINEFKESMDEVKDCLSAHSETLKKIQVHMIDQTAKWQESHDFQLTHEGKSERMLLIAENCEKMVDSHIGGHWRWTLTDALKITGIPAVVGLFYWILKYVGIKH